MRSFDKLRMTTDRMTTDRMTSVIFILLLLQGCGLFKKSSTKTAIDRHHVKIQGQNIWNKLYTAETGQRFFEWRLDSLSSGTVLQIWPRGRFTFSMEKGFEGEAEKVLVTKQVRQVVREVVQHNTQENIKKKFEGELKLKQEVKTSNKIESVSKSLSWKWVVAGLLLFSLLLIYVYRNFF